MHYALRQELAKTRIKDANCALAKYAIHLKAKISYFEGGVCRKKQ